MLEITGDTVRKYIRGLTLAACVTGNAPVYYQYDGHGSVVQLTDATGAVIKNYDYDAFGNHIVQSYDDANPFRYSGEYFDDETDLYYLRARYYWPSLGQFTQEDTHWNPDNMLYGDYSTKLATTYLPDIAAMRQSLNLYVYCGSNPIMYVDPTGGEWYHWVIGGAIVVTAATAVFVTSGGALPALYAIGAVAGGTAAVTPAATLAAGAFIGSSFVFGSTALDAALTSNSIEEFNEQGNWEIVAYTAVGAGVGGACGHYLNRTDFRQKVSFSPKTLQHEYRHAADYGVTGNWNKVNKEAFEQAIRSQIYSVKKPILGTYRNTIQVYHYYNPQTGVDTMIDPSGNFIAGWKLSPAQIENLFRNGNVQ